MVNRSRIAQIKRQVKTWKDAYEPSKKNAKAAADQLIEAIGQYRGGTQFILEQDLKEADAIRQLIIEKATNISMFDVPGLQLRYSSMRDDQLGKVKPKNYAEVLAAQAEMRHRGGPLAETADGLDTARYEYENAHLYDGDYQQKISDLLAREAYAMQGEMFVDDLKAITANGKAQTLTPLGDIIADISDGDRDMEAMIGGFVGQVLEKSSPIPTGVLQRCKALLKDQRKKPATHITLEAPAEMHGAPSPST